MGIKQGFAVEIKGKVSVCLAFLNLILCYININIQGVFMAIVDWKLSPAFCETRHKQYAEVAALQASGFSNKYIASFTGLATNTVRVYGQRFAHDTGLGTANGLIRDSLNAGVHINVSDHSLSLCEGLSKSQKTVLRGMRGGLTYQQIAEDMGYSESNVRNRIVKGLAKHFGAASVQQVALIFAAYEIDKGFLDMPKTTVNVLDDQDMLRV